ncbi:MAG: GreA/GreB family elongation factor [Chthoniobacterales bacterium]|jgi:transcription elongation GreA/GreB family factor
MQPELQTAIDEGKINPHQAKILEQLPVGAYALHKSWGCARVANADFLLGQLELEFLGGRKQAMQMAFAAAALTPVSPSHVEARRMADTDAVRQEALAKPVEFVHSVVNDFGSRLTLEALGDYLGSVLPDSAFSSGGKDAFKRWWTSVRNKLKADGRFLLPSKKSEFVVLRERPASPHLDIVDAFEKARQPKEQAAAAELLLKGLSKFDGAPEELGRVLDLLEKAAAEHQRRNPAHSIHLLCVRDEILERRKAALPEGALTLASFLSHPPAHLALLLAPLPAARIRHALEAGASAGDSTADALLIDVLQEGDSKVVAEATRLLLEKGHLEPLRSSLNKSIAERNANPELLAWLLGKRPDNLVDLVTLETLEAAISVVERENIKDSKRATKLHKVLADDKKLIGEAVGRSDAEAAREFVRKIKRTPVFEEMDKRALLARAIKARPELQELLEAAEEKSASSAAPAAKILTVSWASLEQRKKDYDDLVNVRIPANSRDIQVAREQGDLRENAGFKFAKEQQGVLMRHKAEMEHQLANCRGTNFENPDTSRVSLGTTVRLRDKTTGQEEQLHILGAWDGNSEKNIVSYLAAAATALIGKAPGEAVQMPSEQGEREVEVLSVEAFKNLEIL